MDTHKKAELLNLTTKFVTTYATKNPVRIAELSDLNASDSQNLATIGTEGGNTKTEACSVYQKVGHTGTYHLLVRRHKAQDDQAPPQVSSSNDI